MDNIHAAAAGSNRANYLLTIFIRNLPKDARIANGFRRDMCQGVNSKMDGYQEEEMTAKVQCCITEEMIDRSKKCGRHNENIYRSQCHSVSDWLEESRMQHCIVHHFVSKIMGENDIIEGNLNQLFQED